MLKKETEESPELTGTKIIFRFNFVTGIILAVFATAGYLVEYFLYETVLAWIVFLAGVLFSLSPQLVSEWEKSVVLRFGKFNRLIGPGLFWVIPLVDRVVSSIDQRIMTTTFTAEKQIAEKFIAAGNHYKGNPIALHLRAMNMLYEGLKEKGALIVVPSTAVESMGLGTIGGLAALKEQIPSE